MQIELTDDQRELIILVLGYAFGASRTEDKYIRDIIKKLVPLFVDDENDN